MMGMEMLLSNMIGLKPDELKAVITGLVDDAQKAFEKLDRIEQRLDQILADKEVPENDDGNNGN